MKRVLLLIIFSLAVSSVQAQLKDAGLAQRIALMDMVSEVTITRASELINQTLSQPGMLAVEGYRYQAKVIRSWKGEFFSELEFSSLFSDCLNMLEENERYIVFARQNRNGELFSGSCSDMLLSSESSEIVVQLNNLTKLRVASSF